MKNPLLVPELRELLQSNDLEAMRDLCSSVHPATLADFLGALSPDEIWKALSSLDSELMVQIFEHLDEDVQVEVIEPLSRKELARLFTHMAPDDRVDLLKKIPEEKQDLVMPALAWAEREDIRKLASYEEGTVGSIMTTEYSVLPPHLTAGEAIAKLRREAPDKETIYYSYVVDDKRRLIGLVSLKDLILSPPEKRIEDIMREDVIAARAQDDQEEAARQISKFDLIALPVVDDNGNLVGIVTHDDAIDVIYQENTEDMEKLMAITGAHEAGTYMRSSAWAHFRRRSPWVLALAALGLISGAIVESFEAVIGQITILAIFMPMLADTGGNTGSQSATLVVRALALKETSPRDIGKILLKELFVAIPLSILLSIITFGRVMTLAAGSIPAEFTRMQVGGAISLALGFQVVTSTLVGATLPMSAAALKLDPAVVASPALTTVVDITGLIIYFTTVKIILGI